ncbi:MAG: protein kinase [Acidobacteriota bacterium]
MMIGSIASHYRILDRLGEGGMGEVFLAEDLQLRRPVALKVLSREVEDTEACGRLLREARVASALNHPNIAVIYEIGEAEVEGTLRRFIAMEYVDGLSLSENLRQGRMAVAEVLDIASQLAEALAEAHQRGVVHRDIKPGNVMLTDRRRVKILDFGLAQYTPLVDDSADTWSGVQAELQQPGAILGTIAYMSPEQARGKPVDSRSDVFSLGVLLYEMLSGCQPFSGDNAVEVFDAILREDPPAIPELEAGLGRELERIARKMMSKDRAERYPSMAEVLQALESLRQGGAGPALPEPAVAAAAVLDLVNITGNRDDDWLGTGIAETITADLREMGGMTVIARERVHEVLRKLGGGESRDEEALASQLAREVGARWVICGAYQRVGDLVRVTARVVDPQSGTAVHTVKVDGSMGQIFELQDRIVREISSGLRLSVAPGAREGEETHLVESYEAYSKGVINLRAESPESLDRAILFFERAIALDPDYASAHLKLGSAIGLKATYLVTPQLGERAIACFRRALGLNPDFAEAWRELGSSLLDLHREDEALEAVQRALELEPGNAAAHGALARIHFIGRAEFEEAAKGFERALALNPQGGWYALQLAHCAALLRDFSRGEAAARRALFLQEEFLSGRQGMLIVGAYVRLGHLAALQGQLEDAVDAFDREADFLRRVNHALRERMLIEIHYRKGSGLLGLGRQSEGQRNLERALEAHESRVGMGLDDPFTRYYAACARTLLGDVERALQDLERAAATRQAFLAARARIEPDLVLLREEPRFRSLIAEEDDRKRYRQSLRSMKQQPPNPSESTH